MSSACVCHTNEWCFYCNMYIPLERKYESQKTEMEKLLEDIPEMKSNKKYPWEKGWNAALSAIEIRLKEVLIAHEAKDSGDVAKSKRNNRGSEEKSIRIQRHEE